MESGIQPASEREYLLKPTELTQKLDSLEDSENNSILGNAYKYILYGTTQKMRKMVCKIAHWKE